MSTEADQVQHVREVIEAGTLNNVTQMDALFSRIGYNKHQRGAKQQKSETEAAQQISAMVARDLRANRHQ